MQGTAPVSLIFLALAIIFVGLSLQNYLRDEAKLTPMRQTWLRVAFIFAGISVGLYVFQVLMG
jgi:hypothetical protein